MALVAVETMFDRMAAEIARGRLEAAGIDAVLFDDGIASLIGSGLSGVRLMVAEDDEMAARALLADLAAN
ncbi:MAG: putative signal transducing protein [Janthinobacterium lividum]